jgi:putative colanic acid biosynthesis acetyltransferase WcaF
MWAWRRQLLRIFGARIGAGVHIYPTARISIPWNLNIGKDVGIGDRVILYALGPITIGERATVSQGAHLCAGSHDYRDPNMRLTKPPIVIGPDCWICADAFIGPGVEVGGYAVVGARAVVMSSVKESEVVAGNPARVIGLR